MQISIICFSLTGYTTAEQLQKGLLEHHLRIAFSGIQLLHTEPS